MPDVYYCPDCEHVLADCGDVWWCRGCGTRWTYAAMAGWLMDVLDVARELADLL